MPYQGRAGAQARSFTVDVARANANLTASAGGTEPRTPAEQEDSQDTHHNDPAAALTPRTRRGMLSPATIVHIKHVFGRPPSPSSSAVLDDWNCVRPLSSGEIQEAREKRSGFFVRGAAAAAAASPSQQDPRNSSSGSTTFDNHTADHTILSSSDTVRDEPASYSDSPPLRKRSSLFLSETAAERRLKDTLEALESDPDSDSSDDSHSGDEYTHYNRRRTQKRQRGKDGYHRVSSTALPPVADPRRRDLDEDDSLVERFFDLFRLPSLTAVQRNVLKCSIAYLVATLFTFVPAFSDLLAAPFDLDNPLSGAHVVATVATYYNPAKTLGAMIEADIFMLWASAFAFLVSCGSMATAMLLNNADLHTLSHVVIVGFWLIGSMGLVAWMKVKVSNAQFGSACSMIALIISSIICKEGSVHQGVFNFSTVSQTFTTIIIGTLISNAVCFLVWRGSATSKLQGDINSTLESFATLIDLLCKSFLSENITNAVTDDALRKAIEAHKASFTGLKTSLNAAQLELWDLRIQRTQLAYDDVVASMNRLAQHLTGLRSAANIERDLDAARIRRAETANASSKGGLAASEEDVPVMDAFVQHVGPSLLHLSATLRHGLKELRTSFVESKAGKRDKAALRAAVASNGEDGYPTGDDRVSRMKSNLEQAVDAYKTAHSRAIKKLYRHYSARNDSEFFLDAGSPALSTSPNEEVFLVYFFCFNLEELAKEQATLIDAFTVIRREEEDLQAETQSYKDKFGPFANIVQTFDFFHWFGRRSGTGGRTHRWRSLRKRLIQLMPLSSAKTPSPFPQTDNVAILSHSAAQDRGRGILYKLGRRLWRFGVMVKQPEKIYAIKTGIGCGLLGALAFDHRTRPFFVRYSGNWAMLSYMVVVSTTTGATNFTAFFRIAGTALGAVTAVVLWYIFFVHPVLLCIASFFVSLPCFWIIVTKPKFATSGRFILLSYNLTALYAFNARYTGHNIEEIAVHRIAAVTVGTLWGLFVTRQIFPYEARKELRHGLSEVFLDLAFFYQKIVEFVSTGPPDPSLVPYENGQAPSEATETTPLLHKSPPASDIVNDHCAKMELHLQVALIKLGTLLDHTQHEPRLKGPFPTAPYASVLQNSQRLLDALHSMRAVATRPEFVKTIRNEIILPCSTERREVAGNILLYLSLLASNLSLKAPLPPYLPPAEEARERLIHKLNGLPIVKKRAVRGTTALLLFYSYALMEKDLVATLTNIGSIFQFLFGVMGDADGPGPGVEHFESLFSQGHHDDRRSDSEDSSGHDTDDST